MTTVVAFASRAMEGAGLAATLIGALFAVLAFGVRVGRGKSDAYRRLRQDLGRAILLGLEFLVAGDILRTTSAEPTFVGVAILGGIVLIRTWLSFSLEVELEGTWPWRRDSVKAEKTAKGVTAATLDSERAPAVR
jgi:uncharacterized membrane protein